MIQEGIFYRGTLRGGGCAKRADLAAQWRRDYRAVAAQWRRDYRAVAGQLQGP